MSIHVSVPEVHCVTEVSDVMSFASSECPVKQYEKRYTSSAQSPLSRPNALSSWIMIIISVNPAEAAPGPAYYFGDR